MFVILYCKRVCKKTHSLEEPVVRYRSRSENESTFNNLTEATPFPALSLTGLSQEFSTPSYKNPLLTRSNRNVPKKDSVITLPSFAASTPIKCANVCKKDSIMKHSKFSRPTPKISVTAYS